MGPQGKTFITKVKKILQIKLEALLKANPKIEINSEAFKDAVFATHPSAYEEAGIATLSPAEQMIIGLTPDPGTWESAAARKQAEEIMKYIATHEYEPMLTETQTYFNFTYYYLSGNLPGMMIHGALDEHP